MRVIEFGKNINSIPIVSAVVPCYNIAKRMSRFLVSLLNQTYTNLDVIFVNDGSTDSTEDCIYEYIPKYVDKGMRVRYIYQENKGLGGAINTGLKYVEGEYLIWPNPDDWLSNDSIKKKIVILQNNESIGVVTSNAFLSRM